MTTARPQTDHGIVPVLLAWITLTLAAHGPHLRTTVLSAAVLLLAWRAWRWRSDRGGLHRRWPRLLLAVGALGLIVVDYGTLAGPEAGVALLGLMTVLKALETRNRRDLVVTTQIGLFLAATVLVFEARPIQILLVAVIVTGFLGLLKTLHDGSPTISDWRDRARALGGALPIVAQSIPLMLILFYLFPRLPGPVWSLSRPAQASGQGGLDDRMSPGAISHLGRSDAIAFRVRFDGPVPENGRLYWRGPVLWDTDGSTWRNDERPSERRGRMPGIEGRGTATTYEITLEPYRRRWLYALEAADDAPPGAWISPDLVLISESPIERPYRYRLSSHTDYRLPTLTADERRRALRLPEGHALRTRALGRRWRDEAPDERAVVDRALDYFREQPFHYTLDPPRLDRDPIDEFLFETRRGFCEHYAAAFTLLMRAAGIPSRVVTGYQGGQYNDIGGYLVVRQRDAHAWSEVWLAGRGWTRVDPTAAVSPARIEQGVDVALALAEGEATDEARGLNHLWRRARFGLDALGVAWNRWIADFDAGQQASLFAVLGITGWTVLALVLGGGLLAFVLVLVLWLRRQDRPADPVQRLYREFCRRLARRGLPREPSEGPIDYARRIARARPDLAMTARAICTGYARLRYARSETASPKALARAVRRFRP